MGKLRLAIILVLGIAAIYNLSRTMFDIYGSSRRLENTRTEVAKLEEENSSLEEKLKYRQTAEFIEKEAREKLNMVNEGEKVIIIADTGAGSGSHPSPSNTPNRYGLVYKEWLEVIFK